MFLSHLIFILSAIGFVLFIIRSNRQEPFELFLTFFSFLFFSSNGVSLFLNYYSDSTPVFLDFYGVLNENLALLAPVFCIMLFGKLKSKVRVFSYFSLIFLIGISFALLQYFIAEDQPQKLIFYPSNKNILINTSVQIIYNLGLFGLFIYHLKRINVTKGEELFDGNYKKAFSTLFIVYYILDTLFFISIFLSSSNIVIFKKLYYVMLVSNLILSLLIIALAIYTNWISLITKFKSKWQAETIVNEQENDAIVVRLIEKDKKFQNWNEFKVLYASDYEQIIVKIEQLNFLSKTEKMYAVLQLFDINHKDLAEILNVSLRTIGTNFYRLRLKLKENGFEEDYPYQKKASI